MKYDYVDYGVTPRQYHRGLDRLWYALGLRGVQDESVYDLAARAIMQGDVWKRVALHGALQCVVLTASGDGYDASEWYMYTQLQDVVHLPTVEEARKVYSEPLLRPTSTVVANLEEARRLERSGYNFFIIPEKQ